MSNNDNSLKIVSSDSPEIKGIIEDIMAQSSAIKKREELSSASFRAWLCEVVTIVAEKMGYIVRNLFIEIPADIAYSFGKGFSAGVERAKQNSYRYHEKDR